MDEIDDVIAVCQHDEMIQIEAEEGGQQFAIPKSVLCDISRYFITALSGTWTEAAKSQLRLPGADVDTVKVFVYWLRKGEIPPFRKEIDSVTFSDAQSKQTHADRMVLLARLWALGDQTLAPRLQNAAMEELLDIVCCKSTPFQAIKEGYPLAPPGSQLSRFFISEAKYGHFTFGNISSADIEELADYLGFITEFMCDVKAALTEKKNFQVAEVFGYAGQNERRGGYLVSE